MAGIMNKIGDALHIGGDKKADEHRKAEEHKGEHKEGVMEKIKGKIHGDGEHKEGEKKKNDKKKKDGEKKHYGLF
ncbi:hypothetical protein QQ045_023561 [Rhodiola kirilowii]